MELYSGTLLLASQATGRVNCLDGATCDTGLPVVGATHHELNQIITVAFGIIAALSVLFIIIGGFRYVLSGGDAEDAKRAKYTIIYALIGLAVSISAEAMVVFVLNKL